MSDDIFKQERSALDFDVTDINFGADIEGATRHIATFEEQMTRVNPSRLVKGVALDIYTEENIAYELAKKSYELMDVKERTSLSADSLKKYRMTESAFSIIAQSIKEAELEFSSIDKKIEADKKQADSVIFESRKKEKSYANIIILCKEINDTKKKIDEFKQENLLCFSYKTMSNKMAEQQIDGLYEKHKRIINRVSEIYPALFDQNFNGNGICVFSTDIGVYDGQIKNGKPCGQGTIYFLDGQVYQGTVSKTAREGRGKMISEAGEIIYEGEWKDDMRHGEGREYQKGKLVYEGEWLNNKHNLNGNYTKYVKAEKDFSEEKWESALNQYRTIDANYKDVEQRIRFCQEKISQIQKKAIEDEKKRKKHVFVVNAIPFVISLILCYVYFYLTFNEKQNTLALLPLFVGVISVISNRSKIVFQIIIFAILTILQGYYQYTAPSQTMFETVANIVLAIILIANTRLLIAFSFDDYYEKLGYRNMLKFKHKFSYLLICLIMTITTLFVTGTVADFKNSEYWVLLFIVPIASAIISASAVGLDKWCYSNALSSIVWVIVFMVTMGLYSLIMSFALCPFSFGIIIFTILFLILDALAGSFMYALANEYF